jgi:hypothetical protein
MAIRRTTPALLGLFSLVTLFAHRPMREAAGTFRRQAGWYRKAHPTFADALASVRKELCRPRRSRLFADTKEGEGVPPGIACADLAPLPDTGGIRPATLFLVGAISVLGVAARLFILQRRIGAEN